MAMMAYAYRGISIHSPHARGDRETSASGFVGTISIHSPHARGDTAPPFFIAASINFNPLPSCEGRRYKDDLQLQAVHFNPLPSCEGRRFTQSSKIRLKSLFQSTPLMRGETPALPRRRSVRHYFNPLPSCEGRQTISSRSSFSSLFQSTPLMRGETDGEHDGNL